MIKKNERRDRMHPILSEAKALLPWITARRRWLHSHPGVAFNILETREFVREELKKLGLSPADCGKAGLTATIGHGSPCILLRADMDALPIPEESGEAFASTNGSMHACGHDGHTAMLLGAAKLLKEHESELHGTVKLMFQPAEEIFEGAKDMIAAGILADPKPDAALMLHISLPFPMTPGTIVTMAPGVSAPAADYFTIHVRGKGCHGSTPHLGVDAITAAAHILLALQELHARELAPSQEAVLTIGTIHGGTAANAIADSATLNGTIRTYDEQTRAYLKTRMAQIAAAVASAFRAETAVEFGSGCPVLENDAELARTVPEWLQEVLGQNMVLSAADLGGAKGGGSEDFAYISQQVPTLMLALAAGRPEDGYTIPLHHPKVRIDEAALPYGTAAFVQIALRYLAGD